MAIVLSEESWNELWEASWQQSRRGDPTDAADWMVEYPSQLAAGYKRDITLRNGIDLTLHNYHFHQDLTVINGQSSDQSDEAGYLEFVFNLSSTNRYWEGDYVMGGQHYLLLHGEQTRFYCEELSGQPKLAVDIHLELDVCRVLLGDCLERLPCALRCMIERDACLGDDYPSISSFRPITSMMRLTLEQILNCPYQGTMKQLYLESKSVELLVLSLDQVIKEVIAEPCTADSMRLKPDDVERIHQAKQILIKRMDNPPSLLTLAHQVGLNDRKLKQGFRQVLNTTVFGYLHQCRMAQAQQLLRQQYSIAAVAAAVGYASPTAFNAAFRRAFATSPKAYQLANRTIRA